MARILYLSYDGMTDQLGPSQVLAYLKPLAARGHEITLISHEKPERAPTERQVIADFCRDAGIHWQPLGYHRLPPVLSTLYDVRAMRRLAHDLHGRRGFDIVHCRSYLPGLLGMGMKRRHGTRFLFDMRGFWPDERAESGMWPRGSPIYEPIYRWFKRREIDLLDSADHIVTLTESGREQVLRWREGRSGAPITVIPCCIDPVDFPAFTPVRQSEARKALGIPPDAPVALAVGSLAWYRLDRMMALFASLLRRDPRARFLFVTREPEDVIRQAAAEASVPREAIIIRAAARAEVPLLSAAADFAILFGREGPSQAGRSPVKLGEYLAQGLPVVTDRLIGDVGLIIEESGAGILVDRFDAVALDDALDRLMQLRPDPAQRQAAFRKWFDLDLGVQRYDAVYRTLGSRQLPGSLPSGMSTP